MDRKFCFSLPISLQVGGPGLGGGALRCHVGEGGGGGPKAMTTSERWPEGGRGCDCN